MAEQSFYEDLNLSTPEAVRNLERAIELADKRGPLKIEAQGPVTDPVLRKKIAESIIAKVDQRMAKEQAEKSSKLEELE